MKMPIPNDWDGETLCSYCVQWPDSTLWRIIFRGLISNPMLEAFWDKNTGDVAQVLADFEPTLDFNLNNLECGDMNIPIGTIFLTATQVAPEGWKICNGSLYDGAHFPAAYELLYPVYGDGGIPGFFAVPDLRGRVPAGHAPGDADFDTVGETGGAKSHTLATAEMPVHTHVQNAHTHVQNAHTHTQNAHDHTAQGTSEAAGSGVASNKLLAGAGTNNYKNTTGGLVSMQDEFILATTATNQNATATNQNATATNQNAGGGEAHNNLQPYITLNYIIRVGL